MAGSPAPAEQYDLVVHSAGEVEQSGVEILHLNPDGIDFSYALADLREVRFHLSALLGDVGSIHPHAARKINALRQGVKIRLDRLRGTPALHGALEQRFEHGEQGLRFVESERPHGGIPE